MCATERQAHRDAILGGPADRRATLVTFAKYGEGTAKALEQDHIELARKLFNAMSDTMFRGFTQGLDTLLERLYERLAETEAQRSRKPPRKAARTP